MFFHFSVIPSGCQKKKKKEKEKEKEKEKKSCILKNETTCFL
jgi:hypothetical protein